MLIGGPNKKEIVEAADLEEAVSIVADAFLSAISDFEAAGKEAEPC